MSAARSLAWAFRRRTVGELRRERGARLKLAAALVVDGTVLLVGTRLVARLVARDPQGAPWLVVGTLWGGLALLALLGALHHGIDSERAQLLAILPIDPAGRFRALLTNTVLEGMGRWPLIVPLAAIGGTGLSGWGWSLLLIVGVPATVALGVVAALIAARWLLPPGPALPVLLLGATGLPPLFVLVAIRLARVFEGVSPLAVAPVAIVLGGVLIGPLAGPLGRLYRQGYLRSQAQSRTLGAPLLPGRRAAVALLARHRTAWAALWSKDLLTRGRSWLGWLRLLMLPIWLLALPWALRFATLRGFEAPRLALLISLLVPYVILVESNPSPIGNEGNRVALWLSAPRSLARMLRAKWIASAAPPLLSAGALALGLTLGLGAGTRAAAIVALDALLLLIAPLALVVWGSALELRLGDHVEGAIETLTNEEAPTTPLRVILVNLGALLLLLLLALHWRDPGQGRAAGALVGLGLSAAGYRLARYRIGSLISSGR